MGPLIPNGIISGDWNNVFGLILGILFGFSLEASGFSSSRKIMGTFFGYDFVVLRVFFTAAITAMLGLLFMDYLGWVDYNLLYIHPTYLVSAIAGGIVMGLGFALGGYCPGTSFCAVAIGKLDAVIYTAGLILGILVFTWVFPLLENIYNGSSLGNVKISDMIGISDNLFVFLMVIIALAIFFAATFIQRRVKKVEY